MPRYSRTGFVAAGIAGNIVSRAGKVIAKPAGGACWFDDIEMIYARKIADPDVWALRAHDGMVEIEKDTKGATELRAGGGVWAAELGGPGVRSNRHPFLPLAGLRDVGPDGTLAYCRDRQTGLGLILRALDGATTTLVPEVAACRDVQVHSATQATWIQGGRIRSSYGDPVTPDGRCGVPRVVDLAGKRLLLYWHEDSQGERLLLQTEWATPIGYVLTKPGQTKDGKPDWPAFRPDLIALAEVKACWSITEAEGPTSIRERVIDLSRPTVDLRRSQTVPIAPFDFPTAVTWFFEDSKRPSVTPSPAPGQWSLIVEPGLRPSKPVILGMPADFDANLIAEWADRWDQVRGIYVAEESNRDELQTLAMLARSRMRARGLPYRPIYSYSAQNLWLDIPEIDYLGVQCYPEPNETIAAASKRWRTSLQLAAGRQVAMVCGLYDRRPLVVSDDILRACIPVYAELARERKAQLICFAWGRQGGASEYPSLLPGLMSLAAAVKTLPEVEDDEMNKPVVKVTRFDGLIQRDGWRMEMEDAGNPGVKVQLFTEDGGLRVKFINPAGSNTSGAQRKVL